MKKTKPKSSINHGKVYMNLALANQSKELYGTRPYGGRNGVTKHYPPSKAAITSERPTDFLNDVKNMVFRQEEEERGGSPSWIGKYNKEINHTGEQPLMVQRYLSNNKQEQQDGVLPASSRPPSRFHVEREDDREYHHGLSLHQYLTATEMPGQSEKLVDVKHGRPTRTSLLRARQRTKNIPGPEKTKVELRDDIHYLQEQTLRREDKYKSVDVPDELQPLRDEGESVHQFLVGARYNRTYYRDAKCFNKVGLYVSRENPQHCFLKNGITQEALLANKSEKANMHGAFSEVTASELNSLCQSTSSFQGSQKLLQPPASARQAWGTSSIASAPSPTPNDSRESFALSVKEDQETAHEVRPRNDAGEKPKPNIRSAKRVTLKSAPGQQSSSSVARSSASSCDSCILCQEGSAVKNGMPVHFHGRNIMSAPNRRKWTHHAQRSRSANRETKMSIPGKGQNADLMLVQQYHLRILGTQSQMNKKEDRCHSPDSKVHYSPGRTTPSVSRPKTAAPSSRRNPNRNRNNNNDVLDVAANGTIGKKTSDTASTASKISVHISTGEGVDVEEGVAPGGGAIDPEATPRSQDVTIGSTMDDRGSLADLATPRTLDLIDGPAGTAGEAEVPQSDLKGDSAGVEPMLPSEGEAINGTHDEVVQDAEALEDANGEVVLENGEGSQDCQVNDGGLTDLETEMAHVNLDNSLVASEEAIATETAEDRDREQKENQVDAVIAEKDNATDLNNNDNVARSVTFAEPDR